MSLPITELDVIGYRGLRDVSLHQLGRVNLFVGQNNAGKTSILEALALAANPLDQRTWLDLSRRREPFLPRYPAMERVRWLFPQREGIGPHTNFDGTISLRVNGQQSYRIDARYHDVHSALDPKVASASSSEADWASEPAPLRFFNERRGAQIDVEIIDDHSNKPIQESFTWWEGEALMLGPPTTKLPLSTVTPYEHLRALPTDLYSNARREGQVDAVIALLSQLDPRIEGMEILTRPGGLRSEAVLYLRDRQAGLLPIDAFGDGVRRILILALAITRLTGGILLIDEIETAIHISALGKVFRWMVGACAQRDVQLFATTHSLEAIDATLATDDTPEHEDIVAYRLQTEDRAIAVRRYGEDLLRRLRIERGLEVR